ncbi:type II secretion system F family protein [Bacillus sp. V3B]|uniref:competence type IV pilus assembly protein ComGB n=1 Tax=Bacillus sp. V3B TaxID=2804915 RepID=UPI002108DFF0|nr:competence type IV pilus assembly protein ComGB [Bacillus sp. V3B]MCQ6273714.1 type II secretion system F family protein [Bacillus sp. V3B]
MRRHKWSLEEQASFFKMAGELLSRGYPLAEALESMMYHLPKNRRVEMKECLYDLKEGYPLYLILQKLAFDEYSIGYVFFAEQHGGLAIAFLESSKMMQKRAKDFAKLKRLFSYPIFLILTTILLFIFVQKYLLPRFSTLFSSMNIEANFFTTVIYFFGDVFPYLLFFLFVLTILFLLYYFLKFKKNLPIEQKIKLMRIPILSGFLRLFYTHYFSIQLSYLLEGGLSVNEALTMFERNKEQPFYQQLGREIRKILITGEKLEDICRKYPFFERDLASIVKHGQDNGKLSQELMFFATQCLRFLEEKTDSLMKKIQPIIYIFIGFLIVSMYLAVLLPMFHLLDGI